MVRLQTSVVNFMSENTTVLSILLLGIIEEVFVNNNEKHLSDYSFYIVSTHKGILLPFIFLNVIVLIV